MPSNLTLPEFIARYQGSTLTERAAAQSHFIDLCAVLLEPHPAAADRAGESYVFEKRVTKPDSGHGYSDVWKKGYFAWEYKKRLKSLTDAYLQLLDYRDDLQNPPLLVVCDLDRFEVHTNFTNTVQRVYTFTLSDLASPTPVTGTALSALEVLRSVFTNPNRLRPDQARIEVTETAATEFARLAESLRKNGIPAETAAHFLMRLLFCLFAEDIGLLPAGLIAKISASAQDRPQDFRIVLAPLFRSMANGGFFGGDAIRYFNGGLFADDSVLDLTSSDLHILTRAAKLDWASVEPAIFGTLFERSLDPDKRSQLGAHYTSRDDISLIVEPVLMEPVRREWMNVRQQATDLIAKRDAAVGRGKARFQQTLERLLPGFAGRIASIKVLDPACGSGNFLYVALKELLDLEKEVITFAAQNGMSAFFPQVSPSQLFGIEVNPYAHELASVVVWIGYIQWLHDNGFGIQSNPILQLLHNIEHKDAILEWDVDGRAIEPTWPITDVIIGNPPFLGGKRLRSSLGNNYVESIFTLYRGRVPHEADLVCYWFERARSQVVNGETRRVGLLATNSIRQPQNRPVLVRIKQAGGIFLAWSDRPWILDGADVRVSVVGFDNGNEKTHVLNDAVVPEINSDLTSSTDLTTARALRENAGIAFMGDTKGGAFDLTPDAAARMLTAPVNPNGRFNSDVVRPWVNGLDVTRQSRGMFIIDFGVDLSEAAAALYEMPFEYVERHVRPVRQTNNRQAYRQRWWIHVEPRPALRAAIMPLARFIVTPTVAKHRVFAWLHHPTLPDHKLIVIARSDDYTMGIVHSRLHELWSVRLGTHHGVGNDPVYTPTTTFETFPFPWPPGQESLHDPQAMAIASAARELISLRDKWLNPSGATPDALKTRTLTLLYNQHPAWLINAHHSLDTAVLRAYGWPDNLSDSEILDHLLTLNLQRGAAHVLRPPITTENEDSISTD